jgi:NADPH-dependent 2,4-dienoyl-CoA reductase/sulfur reductase-like enzyme
MRLITGEMKYPQQEGERALLELSRKGIEWIHTEADKIDPQGKRVRTSSRNLEGDYIIIALEAEKLPDAVPGFAESAYNLTDAFGALQLRKALDEFENGRIVIEVPFDLLVGVPPHATPRVVREAGLTDETGWVPVDLQTLESPYPGIFAIGDITSIQQPNPTGFFLPKAGYLPTSKHVQWLRIYRARFSARQSKAGLMARVFVI